MKPIKAFKVIKTVVGPGDAHEVGARGKEIAKLQHPIVTDKYMSVVVWDDAPDFPVACTSDKIDVSGETECEVSQKLLDYLKPWCMLKEQTTASGNPSVLVFHDEEFFHGIT